MTYFEKGVQCMYMSKGYIVPFILIALLLVLAGFIVVNAPANEVQINEVKNTNLAPIQEEGGEVSDEYPSASSTDESVLETDDTEENPTSNTDEVEEDPFACSENGECSNGKICYYKPGGTVGSCIDPF